MSDPDARRSGGDGPERTEDGRYIVVDGRRWRATDPVLDAETAARLRSHLGRARGAVGAARRRGDDDRIRRARARVQAAKEGLGERGTPWWELSEADRHERAADRLGRLDHGDHEAEQRAR